VSRRASCCPWCGEPDADHRVGEESRRPTLYGSRQAVSAGHYLAAAAGFSVLEAGGNAIDAGCCAGVALAVLRRRELLRLELLHARHGPGEAGEHDPLVPSLACEADRKGHAGRVLGKQARARRGPMNPRRAPSVVVLAR
jgi:hypothetical protein